MRLSLATLTALSLGTVLGLGAYTFHHARGTSYFSADPAACANCHVMRTEYESWQKASHHAVASCIDCHLPDDFLHQYLAKAANGYFHAAAFSLQRFREPIRITPKNAAILQSQCVRCHADLIHDARGLNKVACVHCHDAVGHGPSR